MGNKTVQQEQKLSVQPKEHISV